MKPSGAVALRVVPCELREANQFVLEHHRHHGPDRGHRFSLAVADPEGKVRGVAIVGRPKARLLNDGWTAEVTRLATDGCPNACSVLYAAAWRACRAMGYRRAVTFTLPEEGGASLRGAGWRCIGEAGGGHLEPGRAPSRRPSSAAGQTPLGGWQRRVSTPPPGAAMGRPRKPVGQARTEKITAAVTSVELKAIRRAAKGFGLSTSTYLHLRVLEPAEEVVMGTFEVPAAPAPKKS